MTMRRSLLPYTWDMPFIAAMDRASRKTRDELGLYRNLMREMVDIDRIPEQLLDNVALRWGALAWPVEDFIDNHTDLIAFKRKVLSKTWELNKYAGQIVDGRWLCGDIISEMREVDYTYEFGNVAVNNGVVDDASFRSPTPANSRQNAVRITVTPRSDRRINSSEQNYLRRVYHAYLPILMYVLPIQIAGGANIDISAYVGLELVQHKEVFVL